jgi:excinuclease ABC subunit B
VNLLREGLDLPEVSLVGVLDADKEGFLRDRTSLIQVCGRAARHIEGTVILYGDVETRSMRIAIGEMRRRRATQEAYNAEHGITPRGISKEITQILDTTGKRDDGDLLMVAEPDMAEYRVDRQKPEKRLSKHEMAKRVEALKQGMSEAAKKLEFERAASLRDEMLELEKQILEI